MNEVKVKLISKTSETRGKKKTLWFSGAEIDTMDEIVNLTSASQSEIVREGLELVLIRLREE